MVAIAGGSGAGKTVLAEALVATRLGAVRIAHDAYYRHRPDLPPALRAAQNFDHPDALDSELLREHLRALRTGCSVQVPRYDFATHLRRAEPRSVAPAPLIAVDGILLLAEPALADCFDLRVFVDAPEPVRFARRAERDRRERGRSEESIRQQLEATVRPMHEQHVEPSRARADLVVSGEQPLSASLEQVLAALDRRAH